MASATTAMAPPAPFPTLSAALGKTSLVDALNELFPDESSLSQASLIQARLRSEIRELQDEILQLRAELDAEQRTGGGEDGAGGADGGGGRGRIVQIQELIAALFEQLSRIQEKASESEVVVRDITSDIRSLDLAKKNIQLSMSVVKRFQMLVSSTDTLSRLCSTRSSSSYREMAQTLQAVRSLQAFFRPYTSVDRIAAVWRVNQELQGRARESCMRDFEDYFLHDGAARGLRPATMADASLVIGALGDDARNHLVDWYCALQLRDYRRIFRLTDEAGQLDNLARRFAWFRRVLKTHDEEHAVLFMKEWDVGRWLCSKWNEITRDDLKAILAKARPTLGVQLLLESLQSTLEFEAWLSKKYGVSYTELVGSASTNLTTPATLASTFDPYLGVFVEAQDRALADMLSVWRSMPIQPTADHSSSTHPDASTVGPAGGASATAHGGDTEPIMTVLPSSTELFFFYRQTLETCAKLSNRAPFLDLCGVYKKWLRGYADEVLVKNGLGRPEPPSRRSFDSRPNQTELLKACLVLNTADYCSTTVSQLEDKLREKIHEDFKERVSLEDEREVFLGVISSSVSSLVSQLEQAAEPAFATMLRPPQPWHSLEHVSGTSAYVDELAAAVGSIGRPVRERVENKRYWRSFCDRAVGIIISRFTQTIVKLKPISKTIAEQLLLDILGVKIVLLELPKYSEEEATSTAATSYSRYVNKHVSRLETILKVIMTPDYPPEGFVQNYIVLIGDRSFSNFQKMLDLKGVRRVDQNSLFDLFLSQTSTLDDLSDTSFLTALDMDPAQPLSQPLVTPTGFSPFASGFHLGFGGGGGGGDALGGPSSPPMMGRTGPFGLGGGGGSTDGFNRPSSPPQQGGGSKAFSEFRRFGSMVTSAIRRDSTRDGGGAGR